MSYRGSTGSLSSLPMSSAAALAKATTALEQLLEEINFQRTKEMRQMLKDDSGFIMVHGTTYWTDLFVRHFLFQTDRNIDCDDLLFFVRKKHIKSSSRLLPKFETEVDVFRKASRKLPIGDPDMDWEETVYLNLIIHQFDYTLTLAICTRTSPKELQVLRRHSQKVYASPSRRRMDTKAEVEEMTYPNVCFMVDNFNEVFSDIMVRDGEMVCVELVASDRDGAIQGVIFLGSIRYDALKRVYDARSSLSSKMAQRMTFGLFSSSSSQRVEFVRMKGPQGKGHAEMAVTKPKGYSGAETPTSEPGYCATDMWDSDWDSDPEEFFQYRHQRRLSDPSANIHNFVRGGWKTKPTDTAGSKARSENEGLDNLANGLNEIEAGDLRDDCEFCVHSASITTSDASNPLGTSSTVTEASRSSSTLLKKLPPASSIISSFFPSCKLKRPGRAVPILEADVKEVSDSDGEKTDDNLLNFPEGNAACIATLSTLDCEKEPAHVFTRAETSKCLISVANEDRSNYQVPINLGDESVVEARQVDNKPPPAPTKIIELNIAEQCNEESEEEFEDCNSSVSDVGISSGKENLESESQDDMWSDAEDESSQMAGGLHDSPTEKEGDLSRKEEFLNCSHENFETVQCSNCFGNESDKKSNLSISWKQVGSDIDESKTNITVPIESIGKDSPIKTKYERKAVIESCKEEIFETNNRNNSCDYPSCGGTVADHSETDFEECVHGVAMTSLCLLCLGYTNNGSGEKSFSMFRLKSECKNKSFEENSKLKIGKTEFVSKLDSHLKERRYELRHEIPSAQTSSTPTTGKHSQTLPRRRKSESSMRQKRDIIPPQKILPDGTVIYYWCDVPGGFNGKSQNELDDGAYNPLWTMRGFTQTFHFWKENKRAQSVPLNAFLTYVTLPWWSIVKDILDHRESPILTF